MNSTAHPQTPTRRQFLHHGAAAAAGLAMFGLGCASSPRRFGRKNTPPNIVFIFADDLGYGDLGCYGNTTIKTPNLDRMAAEGLRFTSFYANAAVCTPSRAGLLTGRYQVRSGMTNVLFPNHTIGLPHSEITIAEALREHGYATACIGKWHLGCQNEHLPTRHGFDRYFGIPYSNDMTPTPLLRDETVIEEPANQETLTQRYTEESVRFIRENRKRPFFLYVPHTMPHVPLFASQNFRGKSAAGIYGDVVEELDWSVGQTLAALKENGLDRNTLVVFTSDNGPWLAKKDHAGTAGHLRDGKGTTFEGGVRVPCIARCPGAIRPGRVDDRPAIMLDWWPTFARMADATIPSDRIIDGKDIGPMLLGTGARADEEFFFFLGGNLEAHRSGPWKLRPGTQPPQPATSPTTRPAGRPTLLFNLEQDPGETTNLADQHPEIVARLRSQIAAFRKTL